MTAGIIHSQSSGGTLGYDLGDKVDKAQRIEVLDFEGVVISDSELRRLNRNWTPGDDRSYQEFKALAWSVSNSLSKQFDHWASINTKVKSTTANVFLSFAPSDRQRFEKLAEENKCSVSDIKRTIADDYIRLMKLDNTQFVLVEHLDTRCPHMHLAYNRVQFDGTAVDSSFFKLRSLSACEVISKKYGLTPPGVDMKQGKEVNPIEAERKKLAKLIYQQLLPSISLEEFQLRLEEKGIRCELKRHENTGELYGISFFKEGMLPVAGSKLDRKLSFASIEKIIDNNQAKHAEQIESARADENQQQGHHSSEGLLGSVIGSMGGGASQEKDPRYKKDDMWHKKKRGMHL